MIVEW